MLFLKQGWIRFKGLGGPAGQSLRVGRLEFNDGAEVTPANTALAALKRDRIAQRLIGASGSPTSAAASTARNTASVGRL